MWRKRMQPKSTFLADPVRPFLLSYVRHRRVVVWRVRAVLLFFFPSHVGATLRVWNMHTPVSYTHLTLPTKA